MIQTQVVEIKNYSMTISNEHITSTQIGKQLIATHSH
jgi:hypothetical protein